MLLDIVPGSVHHNAHNKGADKQNLLQNKITETTFCVIQLTFPKRMYANPKQNINDS